MDRELEERLNEMRGALNEMQTAIIAAVRVEVTRLERVVAQQDVALKRNAGTFADVADRMAVLHLEHGDAGKQIKRHDARLDEAAGAAIRTNTAAHERASAIEKRLALLEARLRQLGDP